MNNTRKKKKRNPFHYQQWFKKKLRALALVKVEAKLKTLFQKTRKAIGTKLNKQNLNPNPSIQCLKRLFKQTYQDEQSCSPLKKRNSSECEFSAAT